MERIHDHDPTPHPATPCSSPNNCLLPYLYSPLSIYLLLFASLSLILAVKLLLSFFLSYETYAGGRTSLRLVYVMPVLVYWKLTLLQPHTTHTRPTLTTNCTASANNLRMCSTVQYIRTSFFRALNSDFVPQGQ